MPKKKEQEKVGFFKKWYTYQKERFPVIVFLFYTLCIVVGVFIISNYCSLNGNSISEVYTRAVSGIMIKTSGIPNVKLNDNYDRNILELDKNAINNFLAMWSVCFLQFLMVRIIDEFKDYEEDCKYRSYRPVPRGLISLGELKILFAICFILQVIITYVFKGSFIAFALLWIMFLLMTKSFFMKKFLDKHIVLELLLDELMLPVMAIYLMSFVFDELTLFNLIMGNENAIIEIFDWMQFDQRLILIKIIRLFLVMSYFCSCIAEVARKIRSEEKEENGVNTYTSVLGIEKAIFLLCIIELCTFICQYLIIGKAELLTLFMIFAICIIINIVFIYKPEHKYSKLVELSGNMYIAFAYFSMFMLYGGVKWI